MISLVRSSRSLRALDGLDLLVEPLLGDVELLLGLVLGGLRLVLELLDELLGLLLDRLERPVLEPPLAEGDERVVAGQDVDAVEDERHVVQFQVLDLLPAQLEELLGDHVEVGDGDRVDLLPAWPRPSRRPSSCRPLGGSAGAASPLRWAARV